MRLKLVYIDFWSAVKLSFLVAICGAILLLVATLFVWIVLNSLGVIEQVDSVFSDIIGDEATSLASIFSLGQVMFFASIVAVLNIVGGTAIGGDQRSALQPQRAPHRRTALRLHQQLIGRLRPIGRRLTGCGTVVPGLTGI